MDVALGTIGILLIILPFAIRLSDKYRNDY